MRSKSGGNLQSKWCVAHDRFFQEGLGLTEIWAKKGTPLANLGVERYIHRLLP